jgi:hypothetical protein
MRTVAKPPPLGDGLDKKERTFAADPRRDPGSGEGVWSNAQGGLTSVVVPDTEFSRSVDLPYLRGGQ